MCTLFTPSKARRPHEDHLPIFIFRVERAACGDLSVHTGAISFRWCCCCCNSGTRRALRSLSQGQTSGFIVFNSRGALLFNLHFLLTRVGTKVSPSLAHEASCELRIESIGGTTNAIPERSTFGREKKADSQITYRIFYY